MLPRKKWNIQDCGDKMLKIQDFPKQGDANSLIVQLHLHQPPPPPNTPPSPPKKQQIFTALPFLRD